MTYDIISTGSHGNCLILDGKIAIDLGVPFKALRPYVDTLQLVLLSHVHADHANLQTVRSLSVSRPTVRFAVPPWLSGIPARNVDVCGLGMWYDYGGVRIRSFPLYHDVENVGWRIEYAGKQVIYATDTGRIDHIAAPGCDYYFVEANYGEDEIRARIAAKEAVGAYVHEYRTMQTHLSREQADAWVLSNAKETSVIEYLHGHVE